MPDANRHSVEVPTSAELMSARACSVAWMVGFGAIRRFVTRKGPPVPAWKESLDPADLPDDLQDLNKRLGRLIANEEDRWISTLVARRSASPDELRAWLHDRDDDVLWETFGEQWVMNRFTRIAHASARHKAASARREELEPELPEPYRAAAALDPEGCWVWPLGTKFHFKQACNVIYDWTVEPGVSSTPTRITWAVASQRRLGPCGFCAQPELDRFAHS